MRQKIITGLFLCSISLLMDYSAFAQMDYKDVEEGEQYFFQIPENWRPMTVSELQESTQQLRRAQVAYTHPDGKARFFITLNENPWAKGSLDILFKLQKSNLMYLYDNRVRILKEEKKNINGRPYAIFEFIGTADLGTSIVKKYVLVTYSILEPMSMVTVFTCDNRYRGIYQSTAWEIINSLEVKEDTKQR